MLLLRVTNLTAQELPLDDVYTSIPASASIDFTDQGNVYNVCKSQDIRTAFGAGKISLSEGTIALTPDQLHDYWCNACFYQDSKNPPEDLYVKSADGTIWKITVGNDGILSTEKKV